MAGTRTLTIIKPDAFGTQKAGKILAHLEAQGFVLKAARVMHMTTEQAGTFYEVHKERGFFGELVEFMTSGPCMPMVLEKAGAVGALREAIGSTDPAEAAEGTVRKLFTPPIRTRMRRSKPGSSSQTWPELASGRAGAGMS
jgi:nucleoside-diphosphate kinase